VKRTALKRGKRIRPVSAKREAQRDVYEDAKAEVWFRDGGQCQPAKVWPEVRCDGRIDPHHIWQQGKYPSRRADPSAMVVCCAAHHDAIHNGDPRRAKRLELLH
jgi:hypothetical protein